MDAKKLKQLTDRYSLDQISACIHEQLEKGSNNCEVVENTNEVISFLSKAEVVREFMDHGMTFSEALRELGKKIRAVYGSED